MALRFIIQRRFGHNSKVAGMHRNDRPDWIGRCGRFESESVAGMGQSTQWFCWKFYLIR
jgi:hypothetical protein